MRVVFVAESVNESILLVIFKKVDMGKVVDLIEQK